jgi:hypothetical protein
MAKSKKKSTAAYSTAGGVPSPAKKPAPAAAQRPSTPAPAQPDPATPFWTADDLAAINAFNSEFATKLANFDFEIGNLETDTRYQKGQLDTSAKENTAAVSDDAAARGIFYSSLKNAAVYDIEAQRKIQSTFLDSKLTAARLNAGTQKGILQTAKEGFDKAMLQKQGENAAGVNDAANAAWASAQAAWEAAKPASAGAAPVAKATPRPVGVKSSAQQASAFQHSQASNRAGAAVALAKAARPKAKKVSSASPFAAAGLGR